MLSNLVTLIAASLLVFHSAQVAEARYAGIWYMQCNAYTSGGQQRSGAKGPCDNGCFAYNSGQQPGTVTFRGSGNRDQDAGCSRNPCNQQSGQSPWKNFGNQCDEYPMATTYRGPNGFRTLRCVPQAENGSQGGQLRGFVSRESLQAGDTFSQGWIWDRNDAPFFCANAREGSSNPDHSEFKFTNGGFSNARRHARDLAEGHFESISAIALDTPPARRDFLMSNGRIATLAGDGVGIDINNFWADGDEALTIVRELGIDEVLGLVGGPIGNLTQTL